jgi:hypothetical protein
VCAERGGGAGLFNWAACTSSAHVCNTAVCLSAEALYCPSAVGQVCEKVLQAFDCATIADLLPRLHVFLVAGWTEHRGAWRIRTHGHRRALA